MNTYPVYRAVLHPIREFTPKGEQYCEAELIHMGYVKAHTLASAVIEAKDLCACPLVDAPIRLGHARA